MRRKFDNKTPYFDFFSSHNYDFPKQNYTFFNQRASMLNTPVEQFINL